MDRTSVPNEKFGASQRDAKRTGDIRRRLVALLVGAALALSACQTPPTRSSQALTPEEQRMRQQADTFNETVIEGAMVGAALLGVLTYMATGDQNKALKGAAAGAVIGAGAGNYVASKQQQYASEEDRLDSMITDVRSDSAKLTRLNNSARQVIAADLAKLRRIDSALAQGKMSIEEARRETATVDDNRAYLTSTLANLKTRHEEWERVSARVRRSGDHRGADELDREIGKIERQIVSLEGEIDTLSEQRRLSRVG